MSLTRTRSDRYRLNMVALVFLGALAMGCSDEFPVTTHDGETDAEAAARVFAVGESLEKGNNRKQAFAAYHQIIQKYPNTAEGKKAADRIRRARQESLKKAKVRLPNAGAKKGSG